VKLGDTASEAVDPAFRVASTNGELSLKAAPDSEIRPEGMKLGTLLTETVNLMR
jgi:hypothetical protein